jgi:predicted dehydrogenase
MELLAIEKGCHLFVQKPVTLDPAYAQRVQKALVDRGVVSAVGYQLRYDDSLPRLRAWLEHQEVGLVTAFRIGGMPWVWWWRQKELSGGQLVEMSTHEVDLLRYLFGEVRSVQAMAVRGLMTDVVDYDTDDAATVVMHFESGVQATLHNGCFSGHGGRHGITVFTKDGNAQVRPGNGFAVSEPHLSIDLRPSVDTGQEIDETFIEAVQSGDGSLVRSSYADGCRTLAVTLAANRSMERHGEPVNPRSVLDV